MVKYVYIQRQLQINRNKPKTQELVSCPPAYANMPETSQSENRMRT